MKKTFVYIIIFFLLIAVLKYRFSNYNIDYKVNNYQVKTIYKNNRFYYEINDGTKSYNFDVYKSRTFMKTKIDKIESISDETISCVYPKIKNVKTYPLCYVDGVFTDYNLIDSELLVTYKNEQVEPDKSSKDFIYYNNLSDDEYIALWNYKGYTIMNGKSYNNVELFKSDKYDNSIAYLVDDTIFMANNDEEHEYTALVALNIKTRSAELIDLGYTIDFDSYIVGTIDKNLYLFDNKHSILYQINTKNYKVDILSNNEKGFVKYENGKFVSCSKNEYKVDKITYNIVTKSNYTYTLSKGLFKTINDNKTIKQKIINDDVNIISEKENEIFYQYEDSFYRYTPKDGSKKVFYNYELTFNSNNTIFVYTK